MNNAHMTVPVPEPLMILLLQQALGRSERIKPTIATRSKDMFNEILAPVSLAPRPTPATFFWDVLRVHCADARITRPSLNQFHA